MSYIYSIVVSPLSLPPSLPQDSFRHLGETMELAQRISPMALRAVVGTKADLPADQRRVSIEEALVGGACSFSQ